MSDITVASSISVLKQRILRGSPGGVRINTVRLTWATGEYKTATGLPIATSVSSVKKSLMGMHQVLEHVVIIEGEADLGYLVKYDYDSQLFRMFALGGSAAHTHDLFLATGASTTGANVQATTGIISSEIAVTVTGKATTTAAATSGGVLKSTADVTSAASELTDGTTVAEIVIVVQAWGY
jgi:hypothetical protein